MREHLEYKSLGEIANFHRGLTYSKQDEVIVSKKGVLRSNNIDLETCSLNFDEIKYINDSFLIPRDKILKKDSILICMSNGSKQHLGKVAFIDKEYNYAFGGFMGLIIPNKEVIYPQYLYYSCQSISYKQYLKSIGNGANITNLKFQDLSRYMLPVPHIQEQKRIVLELDKLTRVLTKKREQLKELDRLGQAIFYDMFGDPILNENGWEIDVWKKMFDTRLGKMLDKKKQVVTDRKLYYLGNSNVLWGDFNLKSLNSMSFSEREIEQLKLKKGDLLICEGGDAGRCAIWEEDNSEILFQKAIHRARIKDRSVLDIRYVQVLLFEMKRLGGLKNYLSKATIEHLTGEKLNTLQIPVPPITIQQSFAQRMEQIESQKLKIIQSLKDVQQLLDYTMNKYFG